MANWQDAQSQANVNRLRIGTQGYTGNRGTVSRPAIAFEEDSDTGIYSNAAGSLDIAIDGSRAIAIGAAGVDVYPATNDAVIWIPAASLPVIYFTTGTWTAIRIAAGNYVMRHTAAAQTSTIEIPFGSIVARSTASRGTQIRGIRQVDIIATLALTSQTPDFLSTVYANNVATAVTTAALGTVTGTLPTATQANPYVTALTVATPTYIGNLTGYFYQDAVVFAATSAYDFAGIFVDAHIIV